MTRLPWQEELAFSSRESYNAYLDSLTDEELMGHCADMAQFSLDQGDIESAYETVRLVNSFSMERAIQDALKGV